EAVSHPHVARRIRRDPAWPEAADVLNRVRRGVEACQHAVTPVVDALVVLVAERPVVDPHVAVRGDDEVGLSADRDVQRRLESLRVDANEAVRPKYDWSPSLAA